LGVSWDREYKKWRAAFKYNSCYHYIGRFVDEELAAKAYDNYIIENKIEKKLNFSI